MKIKIITIIAAVFIVSVILLAVGSNDLKGKWEYIAYYENGEAVERPYGFEFDRYYTKNIIFYLHKSYRIECRYSYKFGDKVRYTNAYDLQGDYDVSNKSTLKIVCEGYEDKIFDFEIKEDKLYLYDKNSTFVFKRPEKK